MNPDEKRFCLNPAASRSKSVSIQLVTVRHALSKYGKRATGENTSKLTNTKGEDVWHHVQNAVPKLRMERVFVALAARPLGQRPVLRLSPLRS